MIYFAIAIALAFTLHSRRKHGAHLSPDGYFYLHIDTAPVPYTLRPLLPFLLGRNKQAWNVATWISIAAVGALSYLWFSLYTSPLTALFCVGLLCSLSHLTRLAGIFPVLVDAASAAATFGASYLFITASTPHEYFVAMFAVMILSTVNEKVPVFTALWSWTWLPLCALIVPAIIWSLSDDEQQKHNDVAWIKHPFREAIKAHSGRLKSYAGALACWGVLPFAVQVFSVHTWTAIAVAYLPLLRSQDYGRIVLWAAPLAILNFATLCPQELYLPAVYLNYYLANQDATV